ncbi:MAG: endonuclease VII domain-containing protein, partial [Ktedonobacterales bacterium]
RKERDVRDPYRIRKMDLKAKYGLTLEQYNAMHAAQEGRCAICGMAAEKLVVDHNHATGSVRSLLCHLCNAMIGCARESADILVSAAAYLYAERHPEMGRVRAEVAYVQTATAVTTVAICR